MNFFSDPGSGPFFYEIFLHYFQNPSYATGIFFKLGYAKNLPVGQKPEATRKRCVYFWTDTTFLLRT
jgi:hypothetical protein